MATMEDGKGRDRDVFVVFHYTKYVITGGHENVTDCRSRYKKRFYKSAFIQMYMN